MIFLAIDEMQDAERIWREAEASALAWLRPGAPCPTEAPSAEEERLKQVYAKGRDE